MQAVVALCYFCENHGPRVVMTCQPVRASQTNNNIDRPSTSSAQHKTDSASSSTSNACSTDSDQPEVYGEEELRNEVVDEEPRCAACSSFGNGFGIVSNDHSAQTSYISTQVPMNDRVYHIVRQTCMRSLSVEVSTPVFSDGTSKEKIGELTSSESEKEGAVLYGDDENGYTLSFTFKLRDAKARGFQRSYSLVVVTMDHYMLLNNYDFFISGFSAIIGRLQSMALGVFAMEQSPQGDVSLATAVHRVNYMPTSFFPKKFNLDTSRSLTTILNNVEIYYVLHRQMLFLLRTQSRMLRDTVLEGVPTQDMLVLMEREPHDLDEHDMIASLSSAQTLDHVRNLRYLANKLFHLNSAFLVSLVWTLVVGDQLVVRSADPLSRKLFLMAFAHLLPIGCVKLCPHATEYVNHCRSNLVGCSLQTSVPTDELPSTMVIRLDHQSQPDPMNDMDRLAIVMENIPRRNGSAPKIIERFIQVMTDAELDEEVVLSVLNATRNEWLNHAKLLFQLSRQHERINLDDVLKVLRLNAQDSPVLLFFQAGLSQRYKQAVLQTISESRRPKKAKKRA